MEKEAPFTRKPVKYLRMSFVLILFLMEKEAPTYKVLKTLAVSSRLNPFSDGKGGAKNTSRLRTKSVCLNPFSDGKGGAVLSSKLFANEIYVLILFLMEKEAPP